MWPTRKFAVGKCEVEVFGTREEMGKAAATRAANYIRELAKDRETVPVVFATGASQLATLAALTAMPDIPWQKVVGFHMDEYSTLPDTHPASFRRYMRENLWSKVPMRKFHGIEPDAGSLEEVCSDYAALLREDRPLLCLLGIGENGHLAFNDPPADFNDPQDVKVVQLDTACRNQQFAEGWFKTFDEVPDRAITLTVPTLFRIPHLILSVPGPRKAEIVKRAFTEPISPDLPATILREHEDATIYLDAESAANLD